MPSTSFAAAPADEALYAAACEDRKSAGDFPAVVTVVGSTPREANANEASMVAPDVDVVAKSGKPPSEFWSVRT